jgi:hypothetical protein
MEAMLGWRAPGNDGGTRDGDAGRSEGGAGPVLVLRRCIRLRLNDVDRAGHGAALWLSVDAAYERLVRGQELPDALVVALGLGCLGEAS